MWFDSLLHTMRVKYLDAEFTRCIFFTNSGQRLSSVYILRPFLLPGYLSLYSLAMSYILNFGHLCLQIPYHAMKTFTISSPPCKYVVCAPLRFIMVVCKSLDEKSFTGA